MEKQTGKDEQYPWEAVARIAEARVLKVVIGWLLAALTIVVTALGYVGWQTAKHRMDDYVDTHVDSAQQRIDRYVDTQVDSVVLARLVEANVDSLVNAQIAQMRVDSLVARRVEEAEAKLIVPREPQQEYTLSLDKPIQVRVDDSSDSTVVVAIAVAESADYEITAVARDDSMFDPVIAVMARGDDQERVLVDLDDDSGGGLNSLLRVRLEQEIDYELWVAGFLSAAPGTVTLTLRQVEPGT